MTVSLIQLSPLTLIQSYGSVPPRLFIPGVLDVQAVASGWTNGTYSLVPTVNIGSPKDQFSVAGTPVLSFDGTTLTVTTPYTENPTPQQLAGFINNQATGNGVAFGANAQVSAANTAQIGDTTVLSGRFGAPTTVRKLPPASTVGAGARAFVIDSDNAANGTNLGTIVAHTNGNNFVPVYSDGTNWRIG